MADMISLLQSSSQVVVVANLCPDNTPSSHQHCLHACQFLHDCGPWAGLQVCSSQHQQQQQQSQQQLQQQQQLICNDALSSSVPTKNPLIDTLNQQVGTDHTLGCCVVCMAWSLQAMTLVHQCLSVRSNIQECTIASLWCHSKQLPACLLAQEVLMPHSMTLSLGQYKPAAHTACHQPHAAPCRADCHTCCAVCLDPHRFVT